MELWDSLNQRSNVSIIGQMLIKYLEEELKDDFVESDWMTIFCESRAQQNSEDCGVFMCLNAVSSILGIDIDSPLHKGMLGARHWIATAILTHWFTKPLTRFRLLDLPAELRLDVFNWQKAPFNEFYVSDTSRPYAGRIGMVLKLSAL